MSEKGVYAAGRLDADSEGLLVLTDVPWVKTRLADPSIEKSYWVQVELPPGADTVEEEALERLRNGLELADGPTRPARARAIAPAGPHSPAVLGLRDPPVRPRPGRATAWIELGLSEGRNRQVRRMVAAVGLPALRLVRVGVGPWPLGDLRAGETRRVEGIPAALFHRPARRAGSTPSR